MAIVEFGYRPDLLTRKISGVVDHSRWIAALAVCSTHLRNILLPDFMGGGYLTKTFYCLTLFGTQAVVVFFVVSGLLVGGSIVRSVDRGRFDRSGYAIDRASRLYIVLIPAILLTEALRLGGLSVSCTEPESTGVLLGNFFFLQNFTSSPLCNNHPLWSLSSEAFFYVIGPGLLFVTLRRSVGAAALTAALLAAGASFWSLSYTTPLFGLVLWLAGLAPWFIRVRCSGWLGFLPFATVLLLSRSHHTINEFIDALGLALTFALFLCSRFGEGNAPLSGLGTSLASFSYSLYLIHMPIAQAIASRITRPLSPFALRSYLIYGAALAFIVGSAWLFGWLFEGRTKVARNWLRRLTRVQTSSAANQTF